MSSPEVKIGCVSNLFSRMMHFKHIGDTEIGHTHQFDHLTLLAKGKLQVTVEDVVSEFTAPQMIFIKADRVHKLVALSADTVAYCIHALRTEEGDILDPSMIPDGVDATTLASPVCRLVALK